MYCIMKSILAPKTICSNVVTTFLHNARNIIIFLALKDKKNVNISHEIEILLNSLLLPSIITIGMEVCYVNSRPDYVHKILHKFT